MATAPDRLSNLSGLAKADQLAALRRTMAAIPSARDHDPSDLRNDSPIEDVRTGDSPHEHSPSGASRTSALRTIPAPLPIADLITHRAFARGTAVSVSGAGSVLTSLVAAATSAGHHVAVIGQPRFGILSAVEHGARLDKIAFIPDPGPDPLDIASVCLDGVDVVVTTLYGRDVPPTRARALLSRTRTHAGLLVITDGRLPGLDLTIESHPISVAGIGQGRGRVRSVTIETSVHGKGTPRRTGRHEIHAAEHGHVEWTPHTGAESSYSEGDVAAH